MTHKDPKPKRAHQMNEKKYNIDEIKSKYKTLKIAKEDLKIKANSWKTLIEKLNLPTYEQIKDQLTEIKKENEILRRENDSLKKSVSKNTEFDEVGFWLIDGNFERSKFTDFNVPEQATRIESFAKSFYKSLAQKYHPDQGGTDMQMSNLKHLYDQMMTLVEMNDGLGK
ncbi:hypothetical protein [Altericista sp. CCNU0014]|uniref:hypothetical protein n=1 Tax=Altericista sp. CCNU0014 TaxID=3082949 RepID=UPI00384EA5C0